VAVSAAPVDPPVVIGPGGGSFRFTVTLINTTDEPQRFQVWSAVTGPVNREPVLGPQAVTLPPSATISRTLTQQVPAVAPPGTYTYAVRLGRFPGPVVSSDAFPVTKEAAGRLTAAGSGVDAGWAVNGWEEAVAAASIPEGFALSEAQPNPFDARTRLTIEVADVQAVRVEVLDVLGRRVAVLHDGELEGGAHALVFDASSLPAGLYVVRATGEAFTAARRAVLLR
jgi:hypothetical protein